MGLRGETQAGHLWPLLEVGWRNVLAGSLDNSALGVQAGSCHPLGLLKRDGVGVREGTLHIPKPVKWPFREVLLRPDACGFPVIYEGCVLGRIVNVGSVLGCWVGGPLVLSPGSVQVWLGSYRGRPVLGDEEGRDKEAEFPLPVPTDLGGP